MKKQQSFAGLKKLAARFNLSAAAPAIAAGEGGAGDEEEESEENDDPEKPAKPAVDAPEGGADDDNSNDTTEGEEGADSDESSADDSDGEEGTEPSSPVAANAASADYRAGFDAAQSRWAAVLLSDHARANLELATDLLAETDMEPKAIVGMCERHKASGSTALRLLDQTPKVNLGNGAGTVAPDAAADTRKKAAEAHNKRIGAKGKRAMAEKKGVN